MYIEDHCQTKKDPEPHSGSGPLSRSFVFSLIIQFLYFHIFWKDQVHDNCHYEYHCYYVCREYIRAYYPNGFNIFNELPLHLCNINLFLIPLGVWKRNRSIMGFSFFVAPLGALMALLFPEPLFSGFSLLMPRIFGYYVTHAILVVCGLSLATLGFYRPDPKDIPRILKTFGLLAVGAHLINLLLRLTLCPEANYFFTYGAEIGVLKLFWRIIPAPLLYGLPAPLILAGYMYAVCALSRLTQRAEEVSFS